MDKNSSSWGAGSYVKNGILRSSTIPGYDNGNWTPAYSTRFDIEEDKLTDEMTIKIKYLGKDIEFKIEKMKGDN